MRRRPIEPADVPAVESFLAELGDRLGGEAVGERKWIELDHRPTGVLAEDDDGLVGVAPVVGSEGPCTFEVATEDPAVAAALVDDVLAAHEDCLVRAWSLRGRHRDVFEAAGFTLDRVLHCLRRPLPAETWPPEGDLTFRGFEPADVDAWVAVNNRAFAGHPEQGDLTAEDFWERTELPWWDPAGLRLGLVDDDVVGFCWTKVHPGGLGEIYVIGLVPEAAGRGWGTALVAEGLRHLHEDRGCGEAQLYVDGANPAGLALYEKLGFEEGHTDLAFVVDQPNRRLQPGQRSSSSDVAHRHHGQGRSSVGSSCRSS